MVALEQRKRQCQVERQLGFGRTAPDHAPALLVALDHLKLHDRLDAVSCERDQLAWTKVQDVRDLMRLIAAQHRLLGDLVVDEEPMRHAVRMRRTQSERSVRSTTPSPCAENASRTSGSACVVMPAATSEPAVRNRPRRSAAI